MSACTAIPKLLAATLPALLLATAAQTATLNYTFDAEYTGEYADPNATALSGDPISGKYSYLSLGAVVKGSVSID